MGEDAKTLRSYEQHEFQIKTLMVMRGGAGVGAGLTKNDLNAIEFAKSGSMRKLAAALAFRSPKR